MRYPSLSRSRCEELGAQKVRGLEPAVESHVSWVGVGEDLDLGPVIHVAEAIIREIEGHPERRDKDRFEGQMACGIHRALSGVPFEVLDDPGFWRYLSLTHFWGFIAWREEGPFSRGNFLKYVDCESSTESVLTRMYLRANAVGERGCVDIAGGLRNATDFWRSHVLRVQTGAAPPITRAFAAAQREARLPTDPLRDVARGLNRTWTNVVLHLYDDAEAAALIGELRTSIAPTESNGDE